MSNKFPYKVDPIYLSDPLAGGGGGGGGASMGMPYGSAALGLVQLGFAIPAMIKASKLKYQNYGMTPEMTRSVSEANAMRNIGFTGSEYNAYNQQLGQDRAATFARSRELGGGNLASTMMAILNGQNVNARNQLAIQDAALRRQNIATSNALNQETQNLANMNTQLQNQITEKQKQAAAGLMQSSLGNLASVGNAMGGMNADMVKALGGIVAKHGLATSPIKEGGEWEVVKDLKGYPSHDDGGVDLDISDDGVYIKRGKSKILAKHGLVVPKKK